MRLILLFLLAVSTVAAQEYYFTDYSIEIAPDSRGRVVETVSFTLVTLSGNISEVEFATAITPKSLEVYDTQGRLQHFQEGSSIVVPLRRTLSGGERQKLRFVMQLPELVRPYGDSRMLSMSYVADVLVRNFSISVRLPEGSVLVSEPRWEGYAVYPVPDRILTDGRHIIVRWHREQLEPGDRFRILVMYRGEDTSLLPLLLALGGMVAGAAATYLYLRRRTGAPRGEAEKVVRMVLREDEQKVYDLISQRGEILQEEVVRETGFSRSKVSKLVRNLEEKGIIEKEPYRKTNRLRLRDQA